MEKSPKSKWDNTGIAKSTVERLSRAETRLALRNLIVLTRDPDYLIGAKLEKKAAAEYLVRHLRGVWLIAKGAGLEQVSNLIEPAYFEAFSAANSMERAPNEDAG